MSLTLEKKTDAIRAWLASRHVGELYKPVQYFIELREFEKTDLNEVTQYERRLPHWELDGSSYFITFRKLESFEFNLVDEIIRSDSQPLCTPADILEEIIWSGHSERYLIQDYVIMPDHVHVLLLPIKHWTLSKIMKGIKGFSARQINNLLNRQGSLWQDENFDHLIRNESDLLDKISYIHENPVKAGLVNSAQDWKYSSLVTLHSNGRLDSLPHTIEEFKKAYSQ